MAVMGGPFFGAALTRVGRALVGNWRTRDAGDQSITDRPSPSSTTNYLPCLQGFSTPWVKPSRLNGHRSISTFVWRR